MDLQRFAASALLAGAGVLHLVHASTHPRFTWFFLAAGTLQLVASVLVWRFVWVRRGAAALNLFMIALYAVTRFLPVPGSATPEAVDAFGLVTKFMEAGSVSLLLLRSRTGAPAPASPSRRRLLVAASVGATGLLSRGLLAGAAAPFVSHGHTGPHGEKLEHFGSIAQGEVDTRIFDPMRYLREFDYGKVSTLLDGRTLREFDIEAKDVEIEVAPGVKFAAWTYNGRVPGPTIRVTEGDLVRVHFVNNGSHPHTMHFHGFHAADMDGVFEQVSPGGGRLTYEFTAEPFGLHLYHCHTPPLKRHIHKGLYGVFIVDPKTPRPKADEMVMMMNGFDTNFDAGNEVYAVNTVAHYYLHHPIQISVGEPVRIYLVNITEFDLLNSFHSHATFFHEYRTGTSLQPNAFTDTVVLGQGERSILELTYRKPGLYMFHAHVSEFAELGWSGMFEVLPGLRVGG